MSIDPQRTKKLGDLGENFMEHLCIGAGLSKSKPGRDENGWDYFVEFPPNRLPSIYLDAQPAPIKCLCQVKATDDFSNRKINDIKVSNWEHLAKTPLPAFILVVDYKGTNTPQAVYLCHIGQERIAQTLKRIRKLQAAGSRDLHKHDMTLTADVSERLTLSNSDDLARAITKITGVDLQKYVSEKVALVNTLGYEAGNKKIKVSLSIKGTDLLDVLLGLKDAEIQEGSIYSTRFNTDILEDKFHSGRISVEPLLVSSCTLTSVSKKSRSRATIVMKVAASAIPGLPVESWRYRLIGDFVEAVLSPPTCSFSINIDVEAVYDLDAALSALKFICTCQHEDAVISIHREGTVVATMKAGNNFIQDPDYRRMLARLADLRSFLDKVGYRNEFKVKIIDLFQQAENMGWIFVVNLKERRAFKCEIEDYFEEEQSIEGLFASPVMFQTNSFSIIAFCYWNATMLIKGSTAYMNAGDCKVWDYIAGNSIPRTELAALQEEFRSFCEEASDGNLIIRPLELGSK